MRIQDITPQPNYTVRVVAHDGRVGVFDVSPYLQYEAFAELQDQEAFMRISNGGYFIEWACGADLSADTIEARWNELPADAVHKQHPVPFHTELTTV